MSDEDLRLREPVALSIGEVHEMQSGRASPDMAIIGGLVVFGSSGLILGPVTLTVTMLLFEIWRRRTE